MKNLLLATILCAIGFVSCTPEASTPSEDNSSDSLTAGWTKINMPDTGTIHDIFFSNNGFGYAIGVTSKPTGPTASQVWYHVYFSADGGLTWVRKPNFGYQLFDNISVTTNQTLHLAGTGILRLLANGQADSTQIPVDNKLNFDFTDIFFVDNNIGYTLGADRKSSTLFKTTNGGTTWVPTPVVFSKHAFSLFFKDVATGWASTYDSVFRSVGSDQKWEPSRFLDTIPIRIELVNAPSKNIVYLTAYNGVFKSTDGGTTFSKLLNGPSERSRKDVHFITETTGYVSSLNKIYKTTDGGTTWKTVVTLSEKLKIHELHFTDENHGWASTTNGTILRYVK